MTLRNTNFNTPEEPFPALPIRLVFLCVNSFHRPGLVLKTAIIALFLLIAAALNAEDVFPAKPGFDKYGGYLAWKGAATGRFHLETIGGRHFLITPDGHGFLSHGVTHTRGLGIPEESRYDFLKQSLDGDWDKANANLQSNFSKWGYNSLGYGSHHTTRKLLPHFASCQPSGKVSSWMGKAVEFPDVFSESWKQQARKALEQAAKNYDLTSPNLIGIYWNDMPAWDLKRAKHQNGKTWMDAIRALPEDSPGKQRYQQFLKENGAQAKDEDFLVLIAREVYSHIGPITRELFPDTLVFGQRYAGAALPWKVIQEALPYIDVVSVQPNAANYPAEKFEQLYKATGKPVMICDHQSSFNTSEHSNVMWHTLPDIVSVGRAHATYMEQGFATPFLIGYNRCQYIDRYKGGQKILKQGMLQVDGVPYEELVKSVQTNTWRVHQRFLSGSAK